MGNVLSGEFHLIIQNGSEGENKVDLVEVYLAGKRVVKLTSKKDLIDKKVKLLADSEMQINLTGPRTPLSLSPSSQRRSPRFLWSSKWLKWVPRLP